MIKVRFLRIEDRTEFFQEIKPVFCDKGLALQKCDKNLYALIHAQSGWTLRMWSMTAKMAEDWFNAAVPMVDWDCPIEQIKNDPRVIDALKIGKELEEKFLFSPEKEKVDANKN